MKTALIYFLADPTNPKKGYVGQTYKGQVRFGEHVKEAKSGKRNYRCNWIRSLLAKGIQPEFEHVAQVPWSDRQQWEIDYIAAFKSLGFELVNGTPGGEGGPVSRGAAHYNFGKGLFGEKNPMFGKKHTPESLIKMRRAHTGKIPTPETRAKMSAAHQGKKGVSCFEEANSFFGKKHTPEALAKMSEAQKFNRLKQSIDELLPRTHYL